jgi:hypothetical protein
VALTSLGLHNLDRVDPATLDSLLEALPRLERLAFFDARFKRPPSMSPLATTMVDVVSRGARAAHLRELHLHECCGITADLRSRPRLLDAIVAGSPLLEALSVRVAHSAGAQMAMTEKNATDIATPTAYELDQMARRRRLRRAYGSHVAAQMGNTRPLECLAHLERLTLEAGQYTLVPGACRSATAAAATDDTDRKKVVGNGGGGGGGGDNGGGGDGGDNGGGGDNCGDSTASAPFVIGNLPRVRELRLSAHYDMSVIVAPHLTRLELTEPLTLAHTRDLQRCATVVFTAATVVPTTDGNGDGAGAGDVAFAADEKFLFVTRLPRLESLHLAALDVWPRRSLPTIVAHRTLSTVWVDGDRICAAVADMPRSIEKCNGGSDDDGHVTAEDVVAWRNPPRVPPSAAFSRSPLS